MVEQVQQVMMKDPKKVAQGNKLAESNRGEREQLSQQREKRERETKLTYCGAGAVVAIGVLDVINHYIYHFKTPVHQPKETPVYWPKETPVNKFGMDYAIEWTRRV